MMKGFVFVCVPARVFVCVFVSAHVRVCVAQCVVLYVSKVSTFLPCLAFNGRYSQVQEETIVSISIVSYCDGEIRLFLPFRVLSCHPAFPQCHLCIDLCAWFSHLTAGVSDVVKMFTLALVSCPSFLSHSK